MQPNVGLELPPVIVALVRAAAIYSSVQHQRAHKWAENFPQDGQVFSAGLVSSDPV